MSLIRLIVMGDDSFVPSELTAVKAWWDVDYGVTKNGSNLVSSWVDRIVGADAAQATDADKPTFKAAGSVDPSVLGDRACIQLGNSTATWLQTASAVSGVPTGTDEMWLFSVVHIVSSVGFASMVLGLGGASLSIGVTGSSAPPAGNFAALQSVGAFSFNNGENILSDNAVIDAKFTTSAISGRVNGAASGSGSGFTTNAADILTIGARQFNPSGEYPTGYIGDQIVTSALTSVERDKIEGYLAWKYGAEGSLPITHPYRYSAP